MKLLRHNTCKNCGKVTQWDRLLCNNVECKKQFILKKEHRIKVGSCLWCGSYLGMNSTSSLCNSCLLLNEEMKFRSEYERINKTKYEEDGEDYG